MSKTLMNAMIAATLLGIAPAPASAQTIQVPQRQKANWYKAPPELQILDERPVVHDFREAPAAPQTIQLPPGPVAGGRGAGGGAGSLGGGTPGYVPYRGGGLPRADFGHQGSNIPANGIRSSAPLPNGQSTGVHSKTAPIVASSSPAGQRSKSAPVVPAVMKSSTPASYTASYGGYGQGSVTQDRSANTNVKGRLLNNMLNKVK